MILDDKEREKFARYCEQQAHDGKLMADQVKTMNLPSNVLDELSKRHRVESLAFEVVARILRNTESMEIG